DEALKPLRGPFQGHPHFLGDGGQRAVEDADHVGVRAGHQVQRDKLRLLVAAQCLAGPANPELRGHDSVIAHQPCPPAEPPWQANSPCSSSRVARAQASASSLVSKVRTWSLPSKPTVARHFEPYWLTPLIPDVLADDSRWL